MSILQKREEKGKQEGKREGIKEIAKNLLKEGIEIAFVAKTTGLSKSEVEKLKEEI
jgi:predicted transposase/invertase (TIGR01784 family)